MVGSINIWLWNIDPLYLLIFLTFSSNFFDVSSFSYRILVILKQVLRLYCLCFQPNVEGYYIFLGVLHYSHSVLTFFWSKLTAQESFSISFSSSLIICQISSLKTSCKLDFNCWIKASMKFLTFSSTLTECNIPRADRKTIIVFIACITRDVSRPVLIAFNSYGHPKKLPKFISKSK